MRIIKKQLAYTLANLDHFLENVDSKITEIRLKLQEKIWKLLEHDQ